LRKLNYVDIILAGFLLWGGFQGFRRGLIIEVASLVALALGIWGGIHFSDQVAEFVREYWGWEHPQMPVMAFGLTFLVIVQAVWLLGKLLTQVLKMVALNIFNRFAGALFGVVKFGLILGVLLHLWGRMDPNGQIWPFADREKSFLYAPVQALSDLFFPHFQEVIPSLPLPENLIEKKV